MPRQRACAVRLADVADAEREQQALERGRRGCASIAATQVLGPLASRPCPAFDRLRHGAVALVGAPAHLEEVVERQRDRGRRRCARSRGRPGRRSGGRPGPRCPSRGARRSGSAPACAAPGSTVRRCSARPTSPSSRTTSRAAHRAVRRHRERRMQRLAALVERPRPRSRRTTSGITSPARRTITVSPTRTSRRATWSALCSVALVTVTPATCTGASRATGVIAPVRPTCTSIASHRGGLLPAPGTCARSPSAARARRSPSRPAGRSGRACRPRRRCRRAARRAARRCARSTRAGRRRRAATSTCGLTGKPKLAQPLAASREWRRRQRPALDRAERVGVERQRPRRGDARIELAQRAGGAVARIGQRALAAFARARR